MSWTVQQIAERVQGDLTGDGSVTIDSLESLDRAGPSQLSFMASSKYAQQWAQSRAGAALAAREVTVPGEDDRPLIYVDNVDLAVAALLEAMAPPWPRPEPGVHPTAAIDATAVLEEDVRIGPQCAVGPKARIGRGSVLHAGVTVLDESQIGAGCVIWPQVVIRERCRLGEKCIVHANVTIGSDGFGYRPSPDGNGLVKVPQIGTVWIGDGVEIGSGTCIDRGKFSATEIGDGCKIDNLVQIAHNCRLGRCVIIAGCTALAGSVTVGDGAVIGGSAMIRDHVHIGEGAHLAGGAGVMHNVPAGAKWGGIPAKHAKAAAREQLAIQRLPDMMQQWKRR